VAICGAVAIASTSIERSRASVERGGPRRYTAVAFDYFVLFNPDSVVSVVDRIAPGKGREFTNLPDRTATDLKGLLDFVLNGEPVRTPVG
jgi:hypothetical protein